jgi:hypothetical protein
MDSNWRDKYAPNYKGGLRFLAKTEPAVVFSIFLSVVGKLPSCHQIIKDLTF